MRFREVWEIIIEDYKKYVKNPPSKPKLIDILKRTFIDRGFNYSLWLRLCYVNSIIISKPSRVLHFILSTRYGIQIPIKTKIGKGFRINHGVGIIINETAIIGENITLHQFTTIGTWKGQAAILGNNIMIGPGVSIVDDVTIGNNVIIGAGSIIVKDIPSNSVVAGNPARIIKQLDL